MGLAKEKSQERERRHERIESNIGEASEVGLLSGGWVATDEYNRFSVSASFVRVFLPVYLYFLSWMIAWSPLTSQTFHLSLQHISSILSYRRPRLRMSLSLCLSVSSLLSVCKDILSSPFSSVLSPWFIPVRWLLFLLQWLLIRFLSLLEWYLFLFYSLVPQRRMMEYLVVIESKWVSWRSSRWTVRYLLFVRFFSSPGTARTILICCQSEWSLGTELTDLVN